MDEHNHPSSENGGEAYINNAEPEAHPVPPVMPGENTAPSGENAAVPPGAPEHVSDKPDGLGAPPGQPPQSLNAAPPPPPRLFTDVKPNTPARRALHVTGNILFGCFLAFLALLVLLTLSARKGGSDASLLGYSLYIVNAQSMEPSIRAGSVVVELLRDASEIKEGDVITYFVSGANVTHRVQSVNRKSEEYTSFITRGDANTANDPTPIPYANVKGVVLFHIPLLGILLEFLRPPNLGLLVVVIPCFLIIVVELARLARFAKESKARENQ